jgi:uncharacterized membrane protein YGL010W
MMTMMMMMMMMMMMIRACVELDIMPIALLSYMYLIFFFRFVPFEGLIFSFLPFLSADGNPRMCQRLWHRESNRNRSPYALYHW